MGFIDNAKLVYTWSKIKQYLNTGYVAKEVGKSLSSNDFTTAEKTKLANLNEYTVDGITVVETDGVISIAPSVLARIENIEEALTWNGTLDTTP